MVAEGIGGPDSYCLANALPMLYRKQTKEKRLFDAILLTCCYGQEVASYV
jgi:hypothetical protein